jgi:signal transduction histidine kinase
MLTLANEASRISNNLGYNTGKTSSTLNISGYYLYNGDADQSIVYLSKILYQPNANIKKKDLLEAYNQLGQAYFTKSDYPDSYKAFKNALDIAEEIKDKRLLGRQYLNLGVMFGLLNSHKLAEEFFDDGLNLFKDFEDESIEARLSSNLAFCLTKKGEPEQAIPLLEFSTKIFHKLKMPAWLAFSYSNMGDVYLEKEDYEKAESYFKKSLNIHDTIEDVKGRADAFLGAARSNIGLKNYSQANLLINNSLNLYNKMELKTGRKNCYTVLYHIFKHENQPLLALEYLEKSDSLVTIIAKEENNTNITMLNTKLEFEKEKRLENDINQEKLAKQNRYIQWFICLIGVSLLISILIFKSNARIKVLNKELEVKTLNLSENQDKLNQINKNQEKLFSIVGHDLRGPIISLKELLNNTLENKSGESIFRKFAPKLHKDLDHIQFTLDNLLNWGQTQMKGAVTIKENISIKKIVDHIIPLYEKNILEKKLHIINNITEDMNAYADYNHIDIVLRNLINNAIKFTPESGTIWINGSKTAKFLKIEIKDNGVGMCSKTLSKIMDNYVHYSSFGTNMERGTGLGLQLSQEMIKKNDGTIHVESEENKGTTFFITLPLPLLPT